MVVATAGTPGPLGYFLVILMLSAWVAVCVAPSATEIVKLKLPGFVGVPEIVPVEDPRSSPGGRPPEAIRHVYGRVPPVAWTVEL